MAVALALEILITTVSGSYFAGNLVSNKLYLNKGDFKFEDITDKAGTGGNGEWCRSGGR